MLMWAADFCCLDIYLSASAISLPSFLLLSFVSLAERNLDINDF